MLNRDAAVVSPATLATSSSAADSAPAATGKVLPDAPSISLEDSSWTLAMWSVQPHVASLHYAQAHRYSFEIDVRAGTAPRGALPAKPSAAGQITHPQNVMWQDGPDRWIWVRITKPVTAADTLALLAKISTEPPVLESPLKWVQIPGGQKVDTFTSEPEANTLVLCPGPDTSKTPIDNRCLTMFVSPAARAADTVAPDDPLPAHQHRTVGAYTVEVDSSYANKQAALALMNSVQLNR